MPLFLPTQTREIHMDGEFSVDHPETQRPIQCKGLDIVYNADEAQATLKAVFTIHGRSLLDTQQVFGLLPSDQKLQVQMKPEILAQHQAAFFAAEDEEAFLAVGEAACFFLQNYALISESLAESSNPRSSDHKS